MGPIIITNPLEKKTMISFSRLVDLKWLIQYWDYH